MPLLHICPTRSLRVATRTRYNARMWDKITHAYRGAENRLFLLDYDGTLTELAPTPAEAKPTDEILHTLSRLTADTHNTVVIVSGRRHQELDEWLGHLSLAFIAEHGLLYKNPGQDWQLARQIDTSWKSLILSIMEPYVEQIEGTFVEEKTNALVWHWRTATNQHDAEVASATLLAKLLPHSKRLNLRVMPGACIVEVQGQDIDKGTAAKRWLSKAVWDFVLAAGDDTTDEDLFAAMPPDAYTIKIGAGNSHARLRLEQPAVMRQFLQDLAAV